MNNERASKIVLAMIVAGLALMFVAAPASAQEEEHAAASVFDSAGLATLGLGIGTGLVLMGAGAGIGRIGGSTVESMARQPEVAGEVFTPMILTAALIEGLGFFALIVILLSRP